MNLTYNGLDLSTLGEVTISVERRREGGEMPQRTQVTLRAGLDLFERGYAENADLVRQARVALQEPQGLLVWTNPSNGEVYVNQTAALAGDGVPEEWGQYHQHLDLVFTYWENDVANRNAPLRYTPMDAAGQAGTPLLLDRVTHWTEVWSAERWNALRAERREVRGRLQCRALVLADPADTMEARRTYLAARLAELRTAFKQGKDGQLSLGSGDSTAFDERVRLENVEMDLAQDAGEIRLSFACSWTVLPDPASYAVAEWTVDEKDPQSGEITVTLSGRVQALTETAARTKAAAVTAAVRLAYGCETGSQLVEENSAAVQIQDAGCTTTDGAGVFVELPVTVSWKKWRASNMRASFQKTGAATASDLGNVTLWRQDYSANRHSPLRSQRQTAGGQIEAAGVWVADRRLALADRRAQLLAMQQAMLTQVDGADGTVRYGAVSKVVRVDSFQPQINQAETAIQWTLRAHYTEFPNEGSYVTAEFTVAQTESAEEGESLLAFAGRIGAANGTLARAKLDLLRTQVLALYGYTEAQRLTKNSTAQAVSANGDATAGIPEGLEAAGSCAGSTFLELSFDESYRKRTAAGVLSSRVRIERSEDAGSQTVRTVYSGSVTASGPSADAAYAAALARASALGADKEAQIDATAYLRASTVSQDRRQTRTENAPEFVGLSFSHEYVSRMAAGRAVLEWASSVNRDSFGADTESVTGTVAARDHATAEALYQSQVKALYAGRLVKGEQITQGNVKAQRGAGYAVQEVRFDFSFTVALAKPPGRVAARYELEVRRDFLTLTKSSGVSGTAAAETADAARDWLVLLFDGMGLGSLVSSGETESHERVQESGGTAVDGLLQVGFSRQYADRLTGVAGLLELGVSSDVTYSGVRWAVQQVPYTDHEKRTGGVSIPQPAGVQEGSRTVRASATSASLAEAKAWCLRQRALLTGDAAGNRFEQPPREACTYEFVPRTDGVLDGEGANVRLHRVEMTFAEILPDYPLTVE